MERSGNGDDDNLSSGSNFNELGHEDAEVDEPERRGTRNLLQFLEDLVEVVHDDLDNLDKEDAVRRKIGYKKRKVSRPKLMWEVWGEETEIWLDQYMQKDNNLGKSDEMMAETVEPSPDFVMPLSRYHKEWLAWGLKQEDSTSRAGILADEMGMGKTVSEQWKIQKQAHYIKDRLGSATRAVFALEASYRWALSGTPFQNHAGELYSLSTNSFCTQYYTSLKTESRKHILRYVEEGTVMSNYGHIFSLLTRLHKSGMKCVQLDGSMTMAAREAAINRFTDEGDCRIFLMSLKPGGVALNLTLASHDGVFFACLGRTGLLF